MLWFSAERGRGGSALTGLMDNVGGLLKQVGGHWGNFLIKTHAEKLTSHNILTSDSIFQPIWTFDSMLERKSLSPATPKAGFLDFPIFRIFKGRHFAFE